MEKLKRWIKNPIRFIAIVLVRYGKYLPDATYLRLKYYVLFGRKLSLKEPQSFNEKIQWLKLYDRNPDYSTLVDKIEVKKRISEVIGKQYVVPTLGIWDCAEDINFDSLPSQFVLKTNHDSGGVIICKDKSKLNIENVKQILTQSLKRDFYKFGREWPYKNVRRKIFAEKLLVNEDNSSVGDIPDYKFMCFNGKVKCSFVATERNSSTGLKITFFDREWNKLPFTRHYPSSENVIPRPVQYEKMVILAEKLATGIKFVRVDFYELNGNIYFGEMTFYPGCGFEEFTPEEWDYKLGEMIHL